MPTGHTIDHNTFHALLHRKADRRGRIKLQQTELAQEFGITKYTMSRTISKMLEDKRIRQISRKGNNRGYFVVEDPDIWRDAHGQ